MPRENRNTMSARNPKRPANAGRDPYLWRRGFSVAANAAAVGPGGLGLYRPIVLNLEQAADAAAKARASRRSAGGWIYNVADLDAWLAKHLKNEHVSR